jgi:CBS domain-containing protein
MIARHPTDTDRAGASATVTAGEIMNPAPRTCSRFSRVLEAVLIFKDEDCGMVPVVEEAKPIGVVTDRDVALALATTQDLVNRPVEEIMSRDLVTVRTETPLSQVIDTMRAELVRRLLVVDDRDVLAGVISWRDLAGELPARTVGQVVNDVVESPAQS